MSKTKAQVLEDVALLRKQLRNAWAKLGCRCIFNDQDEKIFEEPHCPYHGVYQNDPDGWDPIGDLQKAITARWWEEISKPEEKFNAERGSYWRYWCHFCRPDRLIPRRH
jgi:hypothetical protein